MTPAAGTGGTVTGIDPERRTLTVTVGSAIRHVSWDALDGGTLCALPSLVDEIGLVAVLDTGEVVLRETQAGFWALFHTLGLGRELPTGWYVRVEAGERFVVRAAREPRGT